MADVVSLREAERRDLELMLAWRNNPRLYQWFTGQSSPIPWADHVEWFENRDPDRQDYIIHYGERRVGSVWVMADGEVGIYIGEEPLWGQGVGTAALNALIDLVEDTSDPLRRRPVDAGELWAGMHRYNDRSQALFERVGFEWTHNEGNRAYYEYAP